MRTILRRSHTLLLVVFSALMPQVAVLGEEPSDPAVLWSQATLYRDEWGVPHVYAQTPRALGFAFGYAQAEDHLETILVAYRVANGRAAEVLDESYAASDAFALKMGHARLARDAFQNIDPVTGELCVGFAQGVNAWILEHPRSVPEWTDGIQPQDILALWHAFLMSFAPFDLPGVYHRPPAFDTGNAWALAPPRTERGAATLVINPHQYYDGPFRWYEAHLALGDLNVAGATLYGLPVVLQGHNDRLGWALTPNEPDFADIFEERIASGGERKGRTKGGDLAAAAAAAAGLAEDQLLLLEYMSQAQPYYVRTEAGMEERYVPAVITGRGPLFESGGRSLFSWCIGGYRDFGGLRQLYEMGRAQDFAAFQNALLMHQLPCFHLVYADAEGNIFYLYNAKMGDRAMPAPALEERMRQGAEYLDWKRPAPSSVAAMTWAALTPPEALPHIVNPPSGFVQACGNPPWGATVDPPFGPENFPPWFAGDPDSYRAKRVRQLLRTGTRSFLDNQSMLYDAVAPAAMDMVPALLNAAAARPDFVAASHPDLVTGLDLLRNWNYVAELNAAGMTYYHVWWAMLRNRTGPATPPDPELYAMVLESAPPMPEIMLDAAADAARMMRNDYQSLSVLWGDAHRIRRGPRDEPLPGATTGEPIFVASDYVYDEGQWLATYGYGFAMVVQFGAVPEAASVSPFGASDNPRSPHYADQLNLLLEKRLKRTRFQQDAVWRYAQSARGCNVILYPLGVEGAFTLLAPIPVQARLNTSTEPPALPPAGMATFTLYVTPEWAPTTTPVILHIEIHIPDVLCRTENLDRLAIYGYASPRGWFALPEQDLDAEARLFRAAYNGRPVYAVLGPTDCLEALKEDSTTPLQTPESSGYFEQLPAATSAPDTPNPTPSETPAPDGSAGAPASPPIMSSPASAARSPNPG